MRIQESWEGSGQFCKAAKSDGMDFHAIYFMDCKGSYSFSCESWTIPKLSARTKAAMWAAAFDTNLKCNWKVNDHEHRRVLHQWEHRWKSDLIRVELKMRERESKGARGIRQRGKGRSKRWGGRSSVGAWNMLDTHRWAACNFCYFHHSRLVSLLSNLQCCCN